MRRRPGAAERVAAAAFMMQEWWWRHVSARKLFRLLDAQRAFLAGPASGGGSTARREMRDVSSEPSERRWPLL